MKHALTLIALLACATSHAATLGVHALSSHAEDEYTYFHKDGKTREQREYNNSNPGLYYVFDNGFTVGGYQNSYRKTSLYAGYTLEGPKLFGFVKPAVTAVLATGYSEVFNVGKLRPLVMPALVFSTPLPFDVRWSVVPAKESVFQHLSFEVKL